MPYLTNWGRGLDALESIQLEHRFGRSLNDFFNARARKTGAPWTKVDLDEYWTEDGLRSPPGTVAVSAYTRKAFSYPFACFRTKLPTIAPNVYVWLGFETGGGAPLMIASLWQRPDGFWLEWGGPGLFGATVAGITALMPPDYDTVAHNYIIKLNRCSVELFIDDYLKAIGLFGVALEGIAWHNNPPYSLVGHSGVPPVASITAIAEIANATGEELILPLNITGNSIVVSNGDPLPPEQYLLYTENTETLWRGLATAGAVLTSHPVPLWGHSRKTLVFQADAAGNLDIQVLVGGAWRSWTPGGITLVANQLEVYNLNGEVPVARCVYTPTNADTITAAGWLLGGE